MWLLEEEPRKDEDKTSFLNQHQLFSMVYFIHRFITLRNDLVLAAITTFICIFAKVMIYKVVAGSEKVSQAFV